MFKKDKDKEQEKEEVAKPDIEITKNFESQEKKTEDDYRQLWDKYLRLQADFDNYRKRSFKERAEFIKFANEGLIMELLNILDNFERGVKAADQKKDFDLLHQGVDMISKQLHSLLQAKGLDRIKALGMKFDPHQHEALEVVEDDNTDVDIVEEEMQPGYTLNGRIIRPAKVKVRRPKEKLTPADPAENEEILEENQEDEEIDKEG
ncbi:MAG: nucleotide exchange factor GrpE [Candidatus Omnitrophica bacterium]|nr:nucleotide exchange factor GrpE [Candidatus Omnitrophota bacterium]